MAGGGGKAKPLEFTPTWIVALVCSIIIIISLLFERFLHRLGKRLSPKKLLYEVLLKVKEELMLLGFISLLLTVFQDPVGKVCVSQSAMLIMLPCKPPPHPPRKSKHLGDTMFTSVMGGARRLLAGGGASEDYCLKKGKVPILSAEAIHQLHIFIFVLAVTHFLFSASTVLLGIAQTRNWRHWETQIQINDDSGRYVYFWISLVPFIMLLLIGSKMEHIITELAYEVAQKHTAIQGELVVAPSDELFWFHRPKLVLVLLHIILFQNAFQVAFFFWLLVTYGFKSCILGKPAYVITRVVISVVSQFLCGYSTLPLYAIVSHSIFDENVAESLVNWAENARRRGRMPNRTTIDVGSSPIDEAQGGTFQMVNIPSKSSVEKGTARLI